MSPHNWEVLLLSAQIWDVLRAEVQSASHRGKASVRGGCGQVSTLESACVDGRAGAKAPSCSENRKAEGREASLGKRSGDLGQRKEWAWGCVRWWEVPERVTLAAASHQLPSGCLVPRLSLRHESIAAFSRATH